MSGQHETDQPTRQLAAPRPTQMRGKLRAAIDAMVWDALPRKQAAAKAGITEHGLYKALRKAPIRAAYLAELDVLRTSERARNIHRACEIRDKADNMPAIQAIKFLEGVEDAPGQSRIAQSFPGLVVIVQPTVNAPAAPTLVGSERAASAKPLIDQASDILREYDQDAHEPRPAVNAGAPERPPGGKSE